MNRDGLQIAASSGAVTVQNVAPFQLPVSSFEAKPDIIQLNTVTNYRISVYPKTYLPGMWLELKLPNQIKLADQNKLECSPLSKNLAATLTCTYSAQTDIITVKDGF